MWELRWILLGLGVLLIAAVYLVGRGTLSVPGALVKLVNRSQLKLSGSWASTEEADSPIDAPNPIPPSKRGPPEKILTVRVVSREDEISSEQAVLALREAGLQHGKYGIFHCLGDLGDEEPVFSVASLVEPGSFDLANSRDSKIPGMSFFMVLPGRGDPVDRFDAMVQSARSIAQALDAEMLDERGSSWSIQRERYLREEVIEYRHQLSRP